MKLMFFKQRNILNTKKYKSTIKSENGWYSDKNFTEIQKSELKRTYRTHSPLSLVIIDLSNINQKENKDFMYFLEKIIFIVNKNSRETDLKYLDSKKYIKVLLVDTSLDGAKKFVEKIAEFLIEKFESNSKEIYLRLLSNVKVITQPLNQFSGSTENEVKPIILENHIINNEKKKKSGITSINLYNDMNQYSKPLMSETIALPLSLFHQELLTDTSPIDYKFMKRFADIVGSSIGIILFSPVILIVAILIKLTSKGPILFKQKRLGYLGNEFSFLKFRTMSDDSDDQIHREYVEKLINGQNDFINKGTEDEPLYKLDDDPRITWIGNYLRKYSLDELPQFFNVIKGDMSLVGPRPPIAYEVENYQYWHLRRILEVKPGITGLWQVNGRSKTTFNEMVRLDIQYINNQSFLLDTKILMKTFAAVFNTDGAL